MNNELEMFAVNYRYKLSVYVDGMNLGTVEKIGTVDKEAKITICLSKDKKLSFDIKNKKVVIDGEEEIYFDIHYDGRILLFFSDVTEAVDLLMPNDNGKKLVKLKRFIDNCNEDVTLNDDETIITVKRDVLRICIHALINELY